VNDKPQPDDEDESDEESSGIPGLDPADINRQIIAPNLPKKNKKPRPLRLFGNRNRHSGPV